jgi:hypothetical protein
VASLREIDLDQLALEVVVERSQLSAALQMDGGGRKFAGL